MTDVVQKDPFMKPVIEQQRATLRARDVVCGDGVIGGGDGWLQVFFVGGWGLNEMLIEDENKQC